MEKKECLGCAVEVDANSESCPICGYDFPSLPALVKIMAWIMVILVLLWLLF